MKNKANKAGKAETNVKTSSQGVSLQAHDAVANYTKRNVGIQTVQETKFYVSPQILSHHELEKYDYNRFFYTPKTVTTLVFTLLMLNFFAYTIVPIHQRATTPENIDSSGFTLTQKM